MESLPTELLSLVLEHAAVRHVDGVNSQMVCRLWKRLLLDILSMRLVMYRTRNNVWITARTREGVVDVFTSCKGLQTTAMLQRTCARILYHFSIKRIVKFATSSQCGFVDFSRLPRGLQVNCYVERPKLPTVTDYRCSKCREAIPKNSYWTSICKYHRHNTRVPSLELVMSS